MRISTKALRIATRVFVRYVFQVPLAKIHIMHIMCINKFTNSMALLEFDGSFYDSIQSTLPNSQFDFI